MRSSSRSRKAGATRPRLSAPECEPEDSRRTSLAEHGYPASARISVPCLSRGKPLKIKYETTDPAALAVPAPNACLWLTGIPWLSRMLCFARRLSSFRTRPRMLLHGFTAMLAQVLRAGGPAMWQWRLMLKAGLSATGCCLNIKVRDVL